ncbi:MAG: ABC transporter ATP-binding protein [Clostridia bacterium]|nr:ABC transporter ATP-binding protein [Clostridia bacterium]
MLKKLAQCVGEYKSHAIKTPLYVAGECVFDVIIPFLMAFLIDEGINKGDSGVIIKIGIILIICSILAMFCGVMSGRHAARASSGFAKNLRRKMYHHVQNYSFSNIDKFSASSIVTRHTTDVNNVQMAFQMLTRIAIRAPLMLIFSLIMAFVVNAKLSLIFLAAIPFLGGGLYLIATKAHPIFEKAIKTYDNLNTIVQENVRGIRVVKSYVTENKEIDKFEDVSKDIYNQFSRASKLVSLNNPLMQFTVSTIIVLISWFGGKEIVAGGLTTGEFTSMISYAMQILMSLMILSMILVMMMMARASAERIVEILDEESDITSKENPVTEVKDGSIKFSNVNFSYVKDINKLCLKNVNLEIKSGETVGILGGTGSSKTTLVQLIPRLYDVTTGKLEVGGVDVRDYDIHTLRNEVAMVLQKNVLFSGTIKENLRWGNENATDEELERACKLAQAHDFIMSFPDKYDTYIEQGGTNVSGGQKQRLCIARALLKKPKILILDDSTSAVDTKTDNLIRKAFAEEIPNTTKLIIAQRVSSVQDADKIIVMENGEINAVGTHEELLDSNAIYKEVYESQNQMKGGNL